MRIPALVCSAVVLLVETQRTVAFAPLSSSASVRTASQQQQPLYASVETDKKEKTVGGTSVELGIPCEEECALVKFPKLPDSIYPGVLSGQAQIDLLNHAKENGEYLRTTIDKDRVLNLRQ